MAQEFTNNLGKRTWCGVQIILSASAIISDKFLEVTPPSGCNITDTNSMHHYTVTRSRKVQITKTAPVAYILLLTATAATWFPTTAILNVDPKTGYISAMKMRSP